MVNHIEGDPCVKEEYHNEYEPSIIEECRQGLSANQD